MSELVTARIRATAARLGLPHLTETLTGHVERADAAQLGYLDFLDLILEEELAVREERRLRHALRASKMPHHKTLDDYDFSYQPELDPRKVRDLATVAFVEARANAALLGPPGVGKTHIAVALAVAACRASAEAFSVGRARTSSMELVCNDWVPPSTAAIASNAVRAMLFSICCAVSEQPAVWVWNFNCQLLGFLAP